MATRSEHLNRLKIVSPCANSFAEMKGDGARRFCSQCQHEVIDFEQLTARQIEAHLQASHGSLCARLKRQDGVLIVAQETVLPESLSSWTARRFPALAAGLVTAWLSAGAMAAAAAEPATDAATLGSPAVKAPGEPTAARTPGQGRATLRGTVRSPAGPVAGAIVVARNELDGRETSVRTGEDGAFTIVELRSGVYEVEATREGFTVDEQTLVLGAGEERETALAAVPSDPDATVGVLTVWAPPLRQAFGLSDLVVEATVGPSVVARREGRYLELVTTLHVGSVIKGKLAHADVAFRQSAYELESGEISADLKLGGHVVVFLAPDRESAGKPGRELFEAVPSISPIQIEAGQAGAFVERLKALGQLERHARNGKADPTVLLEWIVATIENPATRVEEARDLAELLDAFDGFAGEQRLSPEAATAQLKGLVASFRDEGGTLSDQVSTEILGAFVTTQQRHRLSTALLSTYGLHPADQGLFELVRRWDEPATNTWLLRQLAVKDSATSQEQLFRLIVFANGVGDEGRRLGDAVSTLYSELTVPPPDGSPAAPAAEREAKLAQTAADLQRDLTALLVRLGAKS